MQHNLSIFPESYSSDTKILYINSSDRDLTPLITNIDEITSQTEEYDGSFADLLRRAPHMAVLNITDYNLSRMNLTILYNDTMQHSLPIIMNVFTNAFYK